MVPVQQWFADPQTCGQVRAGKSELLRELIMMASSRYTNRVKRKEEADRKRIAELSKNTLDTPRTLPADMRDESVPVELNLSLQQIMSHSHAITIA